MDVNRECSRTCCCYCWSCQADRLSIYVSKQPDALLNEIDDAKQRENEAIDKTFGEVPNQVAISKAFRMQIYNFINIRTLLHFFKSIKGYSRQDAKKVAEKINHGCKIYDRFGDILLNLQSCPHIDIRKLSVNQLYMAFDSKWCAMYNEVLRDQTGHNAVAGVVDPGYSEEDFSDLLQVVKAHPVYQSIDKSRTNNFGKREITALLHRTQLALLSGR